MALGQIAPRSLEAVGRLAKVLADESEDVRASATWALARHKEGARDALPELRKAMSDGNDEVAIHAAHAQPASQPTPSAAIPVTVDNFIRAESDLYIGALAKEAGLGKILHRREPASIDNQTVIRLNRDTLYSSAVFDLDAGPATVTLPDAGKRFMSMMVVNQDHYIVEVVYGAGSYTLTKDKAGTRYVLAGVRTLVDPADAGDLRQVHALQDAIKVAQPGSGRLEMPSWDQASQKKVRDALLVLPLSPKALAQRSLALLTIFTQNQHAEASHPISPDIFWVRDGVWRPFGIEVGKDGVKVQPPDEMKAVLDAILAGEK